MRIAKLESITYDPASKSISFSGLNPLSRRKLITISLENGDAFLNAVKKMLSQEEAVNVTYSDVLSAKEEQPVAEPEKPAGKKKEKAEAVAEQVEDKKEDAPKKKKSSDKKKKK